MSCGVTRPNQTTPGIVCSPPLLTVHCPAFPRPPIPCFHTPTSPYLPPNPESGVLCLPFIGFHLSSLLNSTTGIKAGCFDCVAAPLQKSIFTFLHISMLTIRLPFLGYDTMNGIICSYCTDVPAASWETLERLKCSLTRSGLLEVFVDNREVNMCLWILFTLFEQKGEGIFKGSVNRCYTFA